MILIGQEPPAYFENLCDFLCGQAWLYYNPYPIISADYNIPHAVRMRNTTLAKEREHLNGFEWCGHLVHLSLYF